MKTCGKSCWIFVWTWTVWVYSSTVLEYQTCDPEPELTVMVMVMITDSLFGWLTLIMWQGPQQISHVCVDRKCELTMSNKFSLRQQVPVKVTGDSSLLSKGHFSKAHQRKVQASHLSEGNLINMLFWVQEMFGLCSGKLLHTESTGTLFIEWLLYKHILFKISCTIIPEPSNPEQLPGICCSISLLTSLLCWQDLHFYAHRCKVWLQE